MEEAQSIADRLAIMNKGQIAVSGTSQYLKKQFSDYLLVEFVFENNCEAFIRSFVSNFDGIVLLERERAAKIKIPSTNGVYLRLLEFIQKTNGKSLKSWSVRKGGLEEVFNKVQSSFSRRSVN